MLEYPFHEERDNRPVPKSTQQVLDDFGSFEKNFRTKKGIDFVTTGKYEWSSKMDGPGSLSKWIFPPRSHRYAALWKW